jgi:hypothetical protein
MSQSRRVGLILALFFLLVSQAGAWEFSLSGFFTWEYYQFSQLGSRGFFGPYDQDNSLPPAPPAVATNLAARNGWLGHEVASRTPSFFGDDLASGSDVAANYMWAVFLPRVKVNEALSVQGVYRIGSWFDPSAPFSPGQMNTSRYLNSQASGIGNSFSPGYWQALYVQTDLPWGKVTIGKQPNTISMGLILDAYENSNEAVCLTALFGPFAISGQWYVWQPGLSTDLSSSSNYPLKTDRSNASQPSIGALLMYRAGNISSETYVQYSNGHKGPESQLVVSPAIFPVDCSSLLGFTNFKYFDGRIFFNAEVGFIEQVYRQSFGSVTNPTTGGLVLPRTRYWELWAGVIECGATVGPAKMSFLWAYYPGPDRRGGQLIDRQPTIVPVFSPDGGVNLYLPYSLLLGFNYGSGNGSITRSSNHGFITDASTYGLRLDYAVAANLNTYATFLYASRVSQGYGWGWIRPDPADNQSPAMQYGHNGTPTSVTPSGNLILPSGNLVDLSFAIGAPNILERDLGYEIGGGIDWRLIEGYTLYARVAYWKPGTWFKYACVDRRQLQWNTPNAGNRWGINPNREIDPIFGTRISLEVDF